MQHLKMRESFKVPSPTGQQVHLPACSLHCPFIVDRQAGKLQYLLSHWLNPTRNGELTASKADALSIRSPEL